EDSASLLFAPSDSLTTLQSLQRTRLLTRLGEDNAPDLRDRWPSRKLIINTVMGVAAIAAIALLQPRSNGFFASTESMSSEPTKPVSTLTAIKLDIAPPAYTNLPARSESSLDAKAAQGSQLRWQLRISPRPASAKLSFHDGSSLELIRDGDDWSGERKLETSTLYRIELHGVPPLSDQSLHRIDAIADLAPEIRVIEPDRSLTLLASEQETWPLRFEAHDDYRLGDASLLVTLAQGTGENITVKEQTIALTGTEVVSTTTMNGQTRSYENTLDLAALGIARGDDVIVRLSVSDNAQPQPNTTRSASFILRWPPEPSVESSAMEGIVQNTLPAYFRSQRQIIIDSEALIAEQPQLDEPNVLKRSDSIGVDQKILRLRYGQFLGEEFESGHSPGGTEATDHDGHADEAGADANSAAPGSAVKDEAQKDQLVDHDHEANAPEASTFGNEGNILAEYGHVHDQAEAATLLDPVTRKILKSALDEMWQAELHLRTGEPALALPYEYRALGFIKQVQQASRIYLARVGLELPQVDEERRLTGKREDLTDRADPLVGAVHDDAIVADTWTALDNASASRTASVDLTALERWVRDQQARLPDALGVIAAIDEVRRVPGCAECRQRLQARLWPLLPGSAAHASPRQRIDVAGAAWLDALPQVSGEAPPAEAKP
ncbi:MAG: hypothetical protein ABIR16_08525, partial [Dokdonella sp.]